MVKMFRRQLQRVTKPTHSVRVNVAVPHTGFSPTPMMSPLDIARGKGAEAKRLGRPPNENPYPDPRTAFPNDGELAKAWQAAYDAN